MRKVETVVVVATIAVGALFVGCAAHRREGTASAKLITRQQLPVVTSTQCSALLADWTKNEGEALTRLSAEELIRMVGQAVACREEAVHRPENCLPIARFSLFASQFQGELLLRAETVLNTHGLTREYLAVRAGQK
jgi:hypothetical protein